MSTLDLYQYSNNTTILCIWAWERCRSSVWKRLQKKNEKKKTWLIDVKFSTDTYLAITQNHQTLQNSDEKQYCQYGILRLAAFTNFPANRGCSLTIYMLVKLAKTVSRKLCWENVSTMGLLRMVNWGFCN